MIKLILVFIKDFIINYLLRKTFNSNRAKHGNDDEESRGKSDPKLKA